MMSASLLKSHSCSVAPPMSCSSILMAVGVPFLQQSPPGDLPSHDVQNLPSSYDWPSSGWQPEP